MENKKFGVFVGRVCPTHLGHEKVIGEMIAECGINNCMAVIGSSNSPISIRNLFSYEERRGFLKMIFPELKVVGLPDYLTDQEWFIALDDILTVWGINPDEVIFFGGCEEDIHFFFEFNRKCKIVNRFDGSSPKISATEVRDGLIEKRSLIGLLSESIIAEVQNTFLVKWDKLRKM